MSERRDTGRIAGLERDLAQQRAAAKELEALVDQRTRHLFVALEELEEVRARSVCQETATRVLAEADSIAEAGDALLSTFGEELRWPLAILWVPEGPVLRCAELWSSTSLYAAGFAAACRQVTFARGSGLPGRTWADGAPRWVSDLTTDPGGGRVRAAEEDGMISACAFPVAAAGAVRAVIELVLPERREESPSLMQNLGMLGTHMGAALERREARRAFHDLSVARRIQSSVLPRRLEIPRYQVAARMRSAEETGGDYYDVMPCPGGAWLGIGDVSGHGLDAGLIMLMLQSALGSLVRARPDALPSELLAATNSLLYDNIRHRLGRDDFVTCTLLRMWENGRLAFSGAHEEILFWRARTCVWEESSPPGTWLGLRPHVARLAEDMTDRLAPGDLMVLYTDGITEAMNFRNEQFGLDRMKRAIQAVNEAPAETICNQVFAAVDTWCTRQSDDMCLLVLRYLG